MPVAMLSTSVLTNPRRYGRFNALDTPQPINPGMVLLKPTSIANSGGSASIGTNGQVTFSAVTSLSLNGVFSATYDNYMISIRLTRTGTTGDNIQLRLRTAGTDASGSNYTRQALEANSTTVSAPRSALTFGVIGLAHAIPAGYICTLYGPYLAQPTAFRSSGIGDDRNDIAIRDEANSHSLSTSYDGCSIIPAANDITGALQVYGLRS